MKELLSKLLIQNFYKNDLNYNLSNFQLVHDFKDTASISQAFTEVNAFSQLNKNNQLTNTKHTEVTINNFYSNHDSNFSFKGNLAKENDVNYMSIHEILSSDECKVLTSDAEEAKKMDKIKTLKKKLTTKPESTSKNIKKTLNYDKFKLDNDLASSGKMVPKKSKTLNGNHTHMNRSMNSLYPNNHKSASDFANPNSTKAKKNDLSLDKYLRKKTDEFGGVITTKSNNKRLNGYNEMNKQKEFVDPNALFNIINNQNHKLKHCKLLDKNMLKHNSKYKNISQDKQTIKKIPQSIRNNNTPSKYINTNRNVVTNTSVSRSNKQKVSSNNYNNYKNSSYRFDSRYNPNITDRLKKDTYMKASKNDSSNANIEYNFSDGDESTSLKRIMYVKKIICQKKSF